MNSRLAFVHPVIGRFRVGVLPGFRLSLALTVLFLSLLVLLPLAALTLNAAGMGWGDFLATISSPRALDAYRLCFGGALLAGAINAGAGLLLAWVLVRYRFPGRGLVDAIIDLPLALPTEAARMARVLTSGCSDQGDSDFFMAAVVEQGPVRIAISTEGRSPSLAKDWALRMRTLLSNNFIE